MRRAAVAIAAMVGLAVLTAPPASAHSELVGSDPGAGTTLDYAPIGATLTFNQNISESFATVSVVGPGNEQWADGETTVEGPEVTVQMRANAPSGRYTVGYRVTSADGHPITGSYDFTVDAAESTAEPAATPAEPAPTTSSSATVSTPRPAYDPNNPAASEGEREPKRDTDILLATLAIAVVGLGAIAVTLVVRSRNKP
jgi:methionine-rich copper-binding protein CopC